MDKLNNNKKKNRQKPTFWDCVRGCNRTDMLRLPKGTSCMSNFKFLVQFGEGDIGETNSKIKKNQSKNYFIGDVTRVQSG